MAGVLASDHQIGKPLVLLCSNDLVLTVESRDVAEIFKKNGRVEKRGLKFNTREARLTKTGKTTMEKVWLGE